MRESPRFPGLVDLVCADVGGRPLATSDDFFAGMENLVSPDEPVFDPHAYYDRGKVMDGWESRRKREEGHDWCVLQLGLVGRVHAVDIDTAHFLGNHPPYAALDAWLGEGQPAEDGWQEIVAPSPLAPGSHNLFAVAQRGPWSHLRLRIYPDGGVARLRVWGEPQGPQGLPASEPLDLAALANGARAVACSDMFFGRMDNLIRPGKPANMGGGWETRRKRGAGNDWVVVELADVADLAHVELDTWYFKGNFPDRVSVEGLYAPGGNPWELSRQARWSVVLAPVALAADSHHRFDELVDRGPFTHLRVSVYPDGGVARFRAFRRLPAGAQVGWLDRAPREEATAALLGVCHSSRWAEALADQRPFGSWSRLLLAARDTWRGLDHADWLEAFAAHPRIGEDPARLRARFAATAKQSGAEQAGIRGAGEETLLALQEGNRLYEERFGHVFLICATGCSAGFMLDQLRARLGNTPEVELATAAAEHEAITRIRLQKLENPA